MQLTHNKLSSLVHNSSQQTLQLFSLCAGSCLNFSLGQEGCRNDALSLMAPSCCNMSQLSTHMGPFPIRFHELLEKIFGSWSLIRSWTESILDKVLVLNPGPSLGLGPGPRPGPRPGAGPKPRLGPSPGLGPGSWSGRAAGGRVGNAFLGRECSQYSHLWVRDI